MELSPKHDKPTLKLPAEPASMAPVVVPPPVTPQRRNIGKISAFATGGALEAPVIAANRARGAVVALLSLARPTTRRDTNNPPAKRPPRRGRTVLLVLTLLLLTALLACGALAYAYPSAVQSTLGATSHLISPGPVDVTITPKNQVASHSYVITGVNSTPSINPQDRQIKAIPLSYTTPATKSQPVQTIGVKNIAATSAHGTLSFVNGSNKPYVFGTQTPITSKSGITVYLDAPVTIPAAVPGVSFGTATQTATTVTTGTRAEIAAGDVNISGGGSPITIKNDVPFTGGQDAQHYNYATQTDVNTAAASLQASLKQQAQSALQTKVTADQQLANNVTCTPKATPDEPVGDTGTAVNTLTVTVTATCNAEAYDAKGLRTLMGTLLQTQANTDLGLGYTLRGILRTQVTVVDVNTTNGVAHLNVNAQGRYAYNLDSQVTALKTLIKGLSVEKTRSTLLGQAGVSDVQFPNGTTTMPKDVNQIKITIAYPQGFTMTGGATGTPTPSGTGTNGNGDVPTQKYVL
jgi:hypothetical protein